MIKLVQMQDRNSILLTLNASDKIGPKTFQYLAKFFNDDFEKYWQLSRHQLKDLLPKQVLDKFMEAREQYSPEKEIKKLELTKAEYTTIYDVDYPPLLKEIYIPPFVIYYKGNAKILNSSAIAIVGSRKFTQYGKNIGYKLAFDLAQSGLTVVSGLALGLDTVVQRTAVDAGGLTIGVLACGIDQIYPAVNAELARKIIASDGLIISENPPGTRPLKQHFPARNRIISGLSLGTLVVEAAESSG
jgi:DNA processing protein